MQERRIENQDTLRVSPISGVLLPLEEAKKRLDINSKTWPIGTMSEEELKTLYEEKLSTLSFRDVIKDLLVAMVPKILIESSLGLPFELDGRVLDRRVHRDSGLIIAGYLIDFTRIIDPQKASYEEVIRVILEATDFLVQNKIPLSEKVDMNWHYLLGRSFGNALSEPDASLDIEEARRFTNTYIDIFSKNQEGQRNADIFSRGINDFQLGRPGPKLP